MNPAALSVSCLSSLVLSSLLMGYLIGQNDAARDCRKEAILAGVAKFETGKDGVSVFTFIRCKECK